MVSPDPTPPFEFKPRDRQARQHARIDDLTDWWTDQAEADIKLVAAKAVEYGSNSLAQLGFKVAKLQRRAVTVEEALELGCWINAIQKIERWSDAVMRGQRPSDDTLYDAQVYLQMARRIRQAGGWPDREGM